MSVHYCPRSIGVIVLEQTTEQQLDLIRTELLQRHNEVHALWCKAQERADCTDQIDNDLDNLCSALENITSDLVVTQ